MTIKELIDKNIQVQQTSSYIECLELVLKLMPNIFKEKHEEKLKSLRSEARHCLLNLTVEIRNVSKIFKG